MLGTRHAQLQQQILDARPPMTRASTKMMIKFCQRQIANREKCGRSRNTVQGSTVAGNRRSQTAVQWFAWRGTSVQRLQWPHTSCTITARSVAHHAVHPQIRPQSGQWLCASHFVGYELVLVARRPQAARRTRTCIYKNRAVHCGSTRWYILATVPPG